MKTSHIVVGAFMLWSAGLANICLAQAFAMGAPSASADSTQTQTNFLLVQLKNGVWFYGQVVEWNKKDQTLTLDLTSLAEFSAYLIKSGLGVFGFCPGTGMRLFICPERKVA